MGERKGAGDQFGQDGSRPRGPQPVVDAVGLRCRHDRPIQRLERSVGPTEECPCPQSQRAAHAPPVGVGTLFDPTVRTGSQTFDSSAVGAAQRSGSGRRHKAPLFFALRAGSPPGQGRPVAGLAHRALGPAGTGRAVLAAVGASAGPPRRTRRADRPSGSDELARATPPTDSTGGEVPLEARHAQLTFFVMGPPGDGFHPPAATAATLGARSAHRAQRLACFPPAVDGLDHPATPTRRGQLAAPAPFTQSPFVGGDEIETCPHAPGAGWFGKDRSPCSQLLHQATDHRRCTGVKRRRAGIERTGEDGKGTWARGDGIEGLERTGSRDAGIDLCHPGNDELADGPPALVVHDELSRTTRARRGRISREAALEVVADGASVTPRAGTTSIRSAGLQ